MNDTGYTEDCCFNDIRDRCPLQTEPCQCRCHHDYPRRVPVREALAVIVGAFTSGVYCAHCGEAVDECDCVIATGRKALA